MRRYKNYLFLVILALLLSLAIAGCTSGTSSGNSAAPAANSAATTAPTAPKPANPELILASTTSTRDSGIMDVLQPMFEKQTGYTLKPVYVGSGQAITMGERGEADVLLVHAPDSEVAFMAAGNGAERKLVMHNDFIIVGPASDPAKIKGSANTTDALKKMAAAKVTFMSRGDNSGTDQLDKKVWKAAGIDTKGQSWYQETGQGMGATLTMASEKNAYTITDRATYLANQKNLALDILYQGDPALLNVYHVITVNPNKSDKINSAGAIAFMNFMVAKDTQAAIAEYGKAQYGQQLFFPDADKTDKDLGLQ